MDHSTAKPERKLRLWLGVVIVTLLWCIWYIMTVDFPDNFFRGYKGLKLGAVAMIVWWVVFSDAPWRMRFIAAAAVSVLLGGVYYTIHPSLSNFLFTMYSIPIVSTGFVGWALLSRSLPRKTQESSMIVTLVILCLPWSFVRTSGMYGRMQIEFEWRWSKSEEELLLDQPFNPFIRSATGAVAKDSTNSWPGFRGPHRNGKIDDTRIEPNWSNYPPKLIWKRIVGPGWSSFAVNGPFFYTQEQRGEEELVVCYDLNTGEPVWSHGDQERFWEFMTGAGPRATPALHRGKLYTLGATGVLNALDARRGDLIWSRNASEDTQKRVPTWGFSSSPLIVNDLVVVATDGTLAAYDLDTGEPVWYGPSGGTSYSSPHLVEIDKVEQIILVRGPEVISVAPKDGQLFWKHKKPGRGSVVQPAMTPKGDLLISDGNTTSMRRISVARDLGDWIVKDIWTTRALKPYFNDFVIHNDHAYGFNSSVLACIGVSDGSRKWKGGRYGSGQLILLADQSLLIVLSEQGELTLVEANPDQFTEIARIPAIEGKTWNHPVLVGDILLIRNDHEMAAYRLSLIEEQ